jgi:hypothetical protein
MTSWVFRRRWLVGVHGCLGGVHGRLAGGWRGVLSAGGRPPLVSGQELGLELGL